MNKFLEQIQNEKEKNNDYLIYTWYADNYQWEKLTREEYNLTRDQLSKVKIPTLTSQICFLDNLEIISSFYTGRYGYDTFKIKDGEIVECARRVIKESFAINCGCKMTLQEDRKELFINTPFEKIFDKNLNYVSDHFYNPKTKTYFKRERITNRIYDKFDEIEGIKDLPEPFCREIDADLVELITTEEIKLQSLSYINERPVLLYSIKNK